MRLTGKSREKEAIDRYALLGYKYLDAFNGQ